jgi:hypothetical protein
MHPVPMMIYWVLASLILPIVIIRIVGSVSRSFTVDDWGSACLMVAAMWVVGWVLATPMQIAHGAILEIISGRSAEQAPTGPLNASTLVMIGFSFVKDVILLFVLGLILPGVSVRGIVGVLVAAALIAVVTASPYIFAAFL